MDDMLIVPLSKQDLDLLEWIAAWTPEVYKADWKNRRQKPPGFRTVPDMSMCRADSDVLDIDRHNMKDASARVARKLLPYWLVEGSINNCRLTPRGRAALKLHGRECPDFFESHCADIFDDHDLRARMNRDFRENTRGSTISVLDRHYDNLELLPDLPQVWKAICAQYHPDSYTDRSVSRASVRCTTQYGLTYLNGSMREHRTSIGFTVKANDGATICEFAVSLEQFADMLTSQSDTPCTVQEYFGRDGIRRNEPAPPPVSAYKKMQARLNNVEESAAKRLQEIIETVEGLKMGKRAKADLIHQLKVAADLQVKDAAFVAEQTAEEVSKVIESSLTIVSERMQMAGLPGSVNLKEALQLVGAPENPYILDVDG